MKPFFPTPVLSSKIWCTAYVTEAVEVFGIITGTDIGGQSLITLYHKEYPVGTALADFEALDISNVESRLPALQEIVNDINQGNEIGYHYRKLLDFAISVMHQCPLLIPLGVAIERLKIVHKKGERLVLDDIQQMLQRYHYWKARASYLMHYIFETEFTGREFSKNMLERYFNHSFLNHNVAPLILSFDGVSLQREYFNLHGNWPYQDLSYSAEQYEDSDDEERESLFTPVITEKIQTEKLDDFFQFLIYQYLKNNVHYRKCKHCNRLFGVSGNPKTEYCLRKVGDTEKTCRDVGPLRSYEKKATANPITREYKRSYKAHNARIRYGLMTKEEFSVWSEEARKQRDACLAGKLSLEDFVAWLDQDKM